MEYLSEDLGLPSPALPWHTERDCIAEIAGSLGVVAGSMAKVADDVTLLAQTEVGEASEDTLARAFCGALLAFARGDYATSIDRLTQVREIAHRCGGSAAQCDVVHLTFTEAALRAHHMRLARALVAERTAQKPDSRLNRRLAQRVRTLVAEAA